MAWRIAGKNGIWPCRRLRKRSGGKHAGRQVTVTPVADDEDDGGVLHGSGNLLRHPAGTGRRDARKNTLGAGQFAAGFFGMLIVGYGAFVLVKGKREEAPLDEMIESEEELQLERTAARK